MVQVDITINHTAAAANNNNNNKNNISKYVCSIDQPEVQNRQKVDEKDKQAVWR